MDASTLHRPDDNDTIAQTSPRRTPGAPANDVERTREDSAGDVDTIAQTSSRRTAGASASDFTNDVEHTREDSVSESMALLSPFGNSTNSMATFNDLGTQLHLEPAPPTLVPGELSSFPEPHSVDDFLFELDQGIEPSLDPPSSDAPPVKGPSLLRRVGGRLTGQEPSSTIAPSTVAPSIRSSIISECVTLASARTYCFKYLESQSWPYRVYSARTFCESLFASPRALRAAIVSVKRYGDRSGVLHRFLIFHVVRTDGKDFYLRIDRRRDPAIPFLAFGMRGLQTRLASDTVAISGRLEYLYDYTKGGEEALMSFGTPPPLIAAAQILYAITTESQGYNLTKENCWFFTSAIQDILVRNFGAQYESGSLNDPTLANERRAKILAHTYQEASREANGISDALLKAVTLLEDSILADGIKSFLKTLKEAHESIYRNAPPSAYRFGQRMQELLVALDGKLDEHLHACYGVQGARKLTSSVELLDHLKRLEAHLPASPHHSASGNDMQGIISAVGNCAMLTDITSRSSSRTYDPLKYELNSSSAFQSRARRLALSALELLPDCDKLSTLPEIWRLQMNDDIHELQYEFGKQISTQLQFICRHWIALLCEADCADDGVMAALSHCTQAHRPWVAAMGIMGEMEQVCRGLKTLYMWLDSKEIDDIKQTVHDLYRWVTHSKRALTMSSLSILGDGHPFVPSFKWDATSRCHIVAADMDTSQAWPSHVLRIKIGRSVLSAVFSPDGCHLAAASADHTVHVWDAATGASLRELEGHTDYVSSIAYSPNGCYLASASHDHTVHVWDAATGQSCQELKGHTHWVQSIAYSPDGHHLASASADCTICIWDAVMGVLVRELRGHTGGVNSAAFSPHGHHLASAADDLTVHIWDAETGASLQELKGHTHWVLSVAYSPNGHHLASASGDCTVCIWDAVAGVSLRVLRGHTGRVNSAAFSPDGHHLASAADDHTVRVWDAATGESLHELKGDTQQVWSIAYSPDGYHHLVSASGHGRVCVWDAVAGVSPQGLKGHSNHVKLIAFSPDGRHLASTSDDYTVCVWDVANGISIMQRILETKSGYPYCAEKIVFSADGSVLKVEYPNQAPVHLHCPDLEELNKMPVFIPYTSTPSPFPFPVYLEENSLCVKCNILILHLCWLPDYFEPTTPVTQHGNHICIGGEDGMIAFINLDDFSVPDL